MIDVSFKMSDKAFYRSRFSGVLPCEIVEVGSKKIRILIEGYNSKLWVSSSRIMSHLEGAPIVEKASVRLIKKSNQESSSSPQENLPALEEQRNE